MHTWYSASAAEVRTSHDACDNSGNTAATTLGVVSSHSYTKSPSSAAAWSRENLDELPLRMPTRLAACCYGVPART